MNSVVASLHASFAKQFRAWYLLDTMLSLPFLLIPAAIPLIWAVFKFCKDNPPQSLAIMWKRSVAHPGRLIGVALAALILSAPGFAAGWIGHKVLTLAVEKAEEKRYQPVWDDDGIRLKGYQGSNEAKPSWLWHPLERTKWQAIRVGDVILEWTRTVLAVVCALQFALIGLLTLRIAAVWFVRALLVNSAFPAVTFQRELFR